MTVPQFGGIDDLTRECLPLVADTSTSEIRVARELDAVIRFCGKPQTIIGDNDTEFTSRAILSWQNGVNIIWHYITPGKSTQIAYMENLNCRLRDQLLKAEIFCTSAKENGAPDRSSVPRLSGSQISLRIESRECRFREAFQQPARVV